MSDQCESMGGSSTRRDALGGVISRDDGEKVHQRWVTDKSEKAYRGQNPARGLV